MNKYLLKAAELNKEASNALTRYISSNRGDFPKSRLLDLVDKGALRDPGTILRGRLKGMDKQVEELGRKYNYVERQHKVDPDVNREYGMTVTATNADGRYVVHPSGAVEHQPRLVGNTYYPSRTYDFNDFDSVSRGFVDANIASHERVHEAKEVIKSIRQTLPDQKIFGHQSPNVMIRESTDVHSNPYAHLVPPAVQRNEYPDWPVIRSFNRSASKDANLVRALSGLPYGSKVPNNIYRKISSLQTSQVSQIAKKVKDSTRDYSAAELGYSPEYGGTLYRS